MLLFIVFVRFEITYFNVRRGPQIAPKMHQFFPGGFAPLDPPPGHCPWTPQGPMRPLDPGLYNLSPPGNDLSGSAPGIRNVCGGGGRGGGKVWVGGGGGCFFV